MNAMGTVDSVFFQSGFSVNLEPGEMLMMFHRVYTWALLWWLTTLGTILGLAKTDLCPGKPLNPRQTGTAGHPTVSSQRSSHCGRGKQGLCLDAGSPISTWGGCKFHPLTKHSYPASIADNQNHRKPGSLLCCCLVAATKGVRSKIQTFSLLAQGWSNSLPREGEKMNI